MIYDGTSFSLYDDAQPCAMLMYGDATAFSLSLTSSLWWRAITSSSSRPHITNFAPTAIAPLSATIQRLWFSKDITMPTPHLRETVVAADKKDARDAAYETPLA